MTKTEQKIVKIRRKIQQDRFKGLSTNKNDLSKKPFLTYETPILTKTNTESSKHDDDFQHNKVDSKFDRPHEVSTHRRTRQHPTRTIKVGQLRFSPVLLRYPTTFSIPIIIEWQTGCRSVPYSGACASVVRSCWPFTYQERSQQRHLEECRLCREH